MHICAHTRSFICCIIACTCCMCVNAPAPVYTNVDDVGGNDDDGMRPCGNTMMTTRRLYRTLVYASNANTCVVYVNSEIALTVSRKWEFPIILYNTQRTHDAGNSATRATHQTPRGRRFVTCVPIRLCFDANLVVKYTTIGLYIFVVCACVGCVSFSVSGYAMCHSHCL